MTGRPTRVLSILRGADAGSARVADPALDVNAYAVADEVELTLVLKDRGVELGTEGGLVHPVDVAGIAVPAAVPTDDLRALLGSGVTVLAVREDLRARGLQESDLVEGIGIVDEPQLAALVAEHDVTLFGERVIAPLMGDDRRVSSEDRHAVAASVAATLDGVSPGEDDRFRAVDNDEEAGSAFMRGLAAEAAEMLDGKPADRILAWAAHVVPRFVITSSFGAESAVLLHMASRVAPDVPVFFLDTGFHFDETLAFRRQLARDLGLTVLDLRPDLSPDQQARQVGPELWRTDPDRCCRERKTVPLRRALASFDGWATGVRRVQTPERGATPIVEARSHDDRHLVKVAPLAAWTDQDVSDYLAAHDLPQHPLVAQGYPSIGCGPCTSKVAEGADPRAGRWAEQGKSECGIHLAEDGNVVRTTTTPG